MKTLKIRSSEDQNDIESMMSIAATFGGSPTDLIAIREYIAKELQELGKSRILYLLEDPSRTIGMVQLILNNVDSHSELANGKNIAHIHALQVSKDLQRKGFGILIMQQLEEEALRLGITQLTLGVDSDNDKAIQLYKKLGYSLLREAEGRSSEIKLFYMQKSLS